MNFRIERDALAHAAAQVARVAGKTMPYAAALLDVEGDKLTISATDLDVAMATTLAVADTAPGRAAVGAKLLADSVRALRPGAVTVAYDEAARRLRLASGVSKCDLPTVDPADVPPAPTMGDGALVDRAALMAMLGRVLPAASKDYMRRTLTGVLFESVEGRLRLVATDSYRLAYGDLVDVAWPDTVLVPALALGELVRVEGDGPVAVEVGSLDSSIAFGVGATVLDSRLIEGEFPSYRPLIPKSTSFRLVADAEELADAVNRVGAGLGSAPLRLAIGGGTLQLVGDRRDDGRRDDEVAVEWDGPDGFGVAFNPEFFGQAVAGCGAGRVAIGLTDGLKPALVTGEPADSWCTLLMPVQVT